MESVSNLKISLTNHTLNITINRPEMLNCFGILELDEIGKAVRMAEQNADVRAVVFRGAGNQSFSTGMDLKQFDSLDQKRLAHWIKKGHDVFNSIESCSKPTLAAIQGYALGGGLELALSCDIRIASESARLGSPELQHGWLPGWGGIIRLKKLIGEAKAKEIIYFGEHMSAEEAHHYGLVNFLVKTIHLENKTSEIAQKLVDLNPDTFAMAKAALSKPITSSTVSQHDIWFDMLGTMYEKNK